MVLVLSTLSDIVLYLYQVLSKYPIGFRVMDLNSRVHARVVSNVAGRRYGRPYRQMDGTPDPYIASCLR